RGSFLLAPWIFAPRTSMTTPTMRNAAAWLTGLSLGCLAIAQVPAHGRDGADKQPAWTPEACFKVKTIDNVQPSPDGKKVVSTVTETVLEAGSASQHTQVRVANADGTGATALTGNGSQPGSPQWSADGAWVAYLVGGNLCRVRPDGTGGETLTQ